MQILDVGRPKSWNGAGGRERVELPEHVLLPGLINAHTHAAMTCCVASATTSLCAAGSRRSGRARRP